jgi:hypothetical protein
MKSERWRELKEFVESNLRLVVACSVAFVLLLGLQFFIGGANSECLGVADAKETSVSFDTPVIVKRIFVLPGQAVRKGQPLVEVEPIEVNMKMLELTTELESLRSEQKVREILLKSFGKSKSGVSPLEHEILGLQAQVDELRKQQAQAVRYAEDDGVVGTVAFRAREQVAPFTPVITISSSVPNMVYGFIHENRAAEFHIGDKVLIEPLMNKGRVVTGKVISIGNRITPFPDRLQTLGQQRQPMIYGREMIVALPYENQIVMGEKVRIHAGHNTPIIQFTTQAFAESDDQMPSTLMAQAMDLEASGMAYLSAEKSLLVGSDEMGDAGSPFYLLSLNHPDQPVNVPMRGLGKFDDLEAMSASGGKLFAISSLSRSKKDKVKFERSLITRFTFKDGVVNVERALDLRTPLLTNLKLQPALAVILPELEDKLEVEGFAMDGSDAYLALKEPRLPDGTSVILKIRGLAQAIEAGRIDRLDLDVYQMLKLDSRMCDEPSKITDMLKTKRGLLILSNCRRSEKTGQIWYLADGATAAQIEMLTTLRHGRPEAMALSDGQTLFVGSDNGKKKGSDLIRLEISAAKIQ